MAKSRIDDAAPDWTFTASGCCKLKHPMGIITVHPDWDDPNRFDFVIYWPRGTGRRYAPRTYATREEAMSAALLELRRPHQSRPRTRSTSRTSDSRQHL